ncbi:MAG: divergent PAP2 family protein [Erysipelothrix sp.]|nr:divergent PAP2 family protein [Erysipelothrix sp.]
MKHLFPIWISFSALIIAQLLKPVSHFIKTGKWKFKLFFDSGGLPSSHSSMVSALVLSVGLVEKFSSTIFAVTVIFAFIVMYDAANIRFYAGKNIQTTQQLIRDLKANNVHSPILNDPIYEAPTKEILGHSWLEVICGAILGAAIAGLWFLIVK